MYSTGVHTDTLGVACQALDLHITSMGCIQTWQFKSKGYVTIYIGKVKRIQS